jgi:hypothetical protein
MAPATSTLEQSCVALAVSESRILNRQRSRFAVDSTLCDHEPRRQNEIVGRDAHSRMAVMRVLVLGGVTGPCVFALVTLVAAALRPDYSHLASPISELGANGTPHAALMNYAGFVPAGLMLVAFGVALARLLPRHRLTIGAAVLVTLFGSGLAAAGVISCEPGCPATGGTLQQVVHDAIGPLMVLCLIAGAGILGIHFRRHPAWRYLSSYSLVTSVLGLFFLAALMNSRLQASSLTGLWQRLLLAVLLGWCAVIALQARRHPPAFHQCGRIVQTTS